MDKSYYIEYYKLEREHWWFVVRGKILMSSLKDRIGDKRDLRILNVGVATGRTSELLEQFGKVTSVEFDKDCFEFTKEKTSLDIQQGSILDLQFPDKSFDLVCAFDVIEHVEDDQKAVDELIRVTKTGGIVDITVPAFQFLWSQHDVVNHHYRRYTMSQLLDLTKSHPVEYIFKTYFNSLLFPPIAAFRIIANKILGNKIRSGAGSDNTLISLNNPINKILYSVFSLERPLLKFIRFPFGLSIALMIKVK